MCVDGRMLKKLKALVCKNQTISKFCGKGEKFYFFLILILDRLDYNYYHWILFLGKYFFSEKIQIKFR